MGRPCKQRRWNSFLHPIVSVCIAEDQKVDELLPVHAIESHEHTPTVAQNGSQRVLPVPPNGAILLRAIHDLRTVGVVLPGDGLRECAGWLCVCACGGRGKVTGQSAKREIATLQTAKQIIRRLRNATLKS